MRRTRNYFRTLKLESGPTGSPPISAPLRIVIRDPGTRIASTKQIARTQPRRTRRRAERLGVPSTDARIHRSDESWKSRSPYYDLPCTSYEAGISALVRALEPLLEPLVFSSEVVWDQSWDAKIVSYGIHNNAL